MLLCFIYTYRATSNSDSGAGQTPAQAEAAAALMAAVAAQRQAEQLEGEDVVSSLPAHTNKTTTQMSWTADNSALGSQPQPTSSDEGAQLSSQLAHESGAAGIVTQTAPAALWGRQRGGERERTGAEAAEARVLDMPTNDDTSGANRTSAPAARYQAQPGAVRAAFTVVRNQERDAPDEYAHSMMLPQARQPLASGAAVDLLEG